MHSAATLCFAFGIWKLALCFVHCSLFNSSSIRISCIVHCVLRSLCFVLYSLFNGIRISCIQHQHCALHLAFGNLHCALCFVHCSTAAALESVALAESRLALAFHPTSSRALPSPDKDTSTSLHGNIFW